MSQKRDNGSATADASAPPCFEETAQYLSDAIERHLRANESLGALYRAGKLTAEQVLERAAQIDTRLYKDWDDA